MAQSSNSSSTSDCLKNRLTEVEEKAKAAEFQQEMATTLQQLLEAKESEISNYREALSGIVATWKEQDSAIREMKQHLESCYPNWECDLKHSVCTDVICKNWELRLGYESKMGEPRLRLEYAKADFENAEEHLKAWKIITSWISDRLDENKALYERICALDSCNNPLLQLYLFYFVLWPQHRQLCMSPDKLGDKEKNPAYAYCDSCQPPPEACSCLPGYPYIIHPDKYDCQLTWVWESLRVAGEKQTAAQSAFDQIATDKEEYKNSSTDEVIESKAQDALRKYHKSEEKPCPESDDEPCEPVTDDTEDPCKKDPCQPEVEEEEDCKPDETLDPCDPPVWECPDPCEEPSPEPCKEPEPEPEPCDEEKPEEPKDDPCDEPDTQDQQTQQTMPSEGRSAS